MCTWYLTLVGDQIGPVRCSRYVCSAVGAAATRDAEGVYVYHIISIR